MHRGALLVVLAIAFSSAAQAQDDGYPAGEVLAAFATACSGVEDTAVNMASAAAAGWEPLDADSDTPIGALVKQGQAALLAEAAAQGASPQLMSGGEFRKEVAGRMLYLAVSGVLIEDMTSRGCRLYDFDAPRGLTDDELEQWAARRPNGREDLPGGVTKAVFNPGLKPGHMEMEAYFVPPGADPLPGFRLSGIGLVASAIEFNLQEGS